MDFEFSERDHCKWPKNVLYSAAVSSLLFFILFFLSAIIFSQVLLKSEVVTVPDLTGKPSPRPGPSSRRRT